MPMMAITTSNSTSVNPARLRGTETMKAPSQNGDKKKNRNDVGETETLTLAQDIAHSKSG
jgi:hypothetical protein